MWKRGGWALCLHSIGVLSMVHWRSIFLFVFFALIPYGTGFGSGAFAYSEHFVAGSVMEA